jgi:uncharacterized membrane protein HdeD (DUF308 family)
VIEFLVLGLVAILAGILATNTFEGDVALMFLIGAAICASFAVRALTVWAAGRYPPRRP